MKRNLKNLSLITIAARFWDKHRFQNVYQVIHGSKYKLATKKFCKKVDAMELPETLKADLKVVIIDFESKKRAMMHAMLRAGISLTYANVVRWNGLGMVDLDKTEKEWENMMAKLSARPLCSPISTRFSNRLFKQPTTIYFQVNPDSHPLLVFEELAAMDKSGLVYYGRPRKEDHAGFVISLLDKSKFDNPNDLRLARPIHDSSDRAESELDVRRFDYPDHNADVAHFVFEILNEEQRQQVFRLGQSELVTENDEFSDFFANIFLHWPWQDEAFNSYFTSKDKFTEADCVVLKKIIEYKKVQEMDILPPNHSFYKKVERFHNTVCRRCGVDHRV